ncbi:MraY family glycosyltransferase [Litorivivens sp.]|uniref:MraY family glycosyltransferase n=1 Tax=Litorivivens sp. TaxID=2020868 RepID=UPI003567CC30
MLALVLTASISFALCTILLQILIKNATSLRLIDEPGGRKHHQAPTPLVGGLAIGASAFSAILWPEVMTSNLIWFWPALFVLLITGLYDDRHELSPKKRLITQIVASLIMAVLADVSITSLGDIYGIGPIQLIALSIPVTIFAVLSAINAFNMIDGLDGLAGGLAFIPLTILSAIAAKAELWPQAILSGAFAAALFSFLLINYRFPWTSRAKAFLGDTGSTTLGFAIAWLLVSSSESSLISPVTALYLIAIPLLDTAAVMFRRKINGRPLMEPGRDHLHHILRQSGLSVTSTVTAIHSIALLLAAIGLTLSALRIPEFISFGGFCMLLLVFVWFTSKRNDAIASGMLKPMQQDSLG